jgi:hypothetical protein
MNDYQRFLQVVVDNGCPQITVSGVYGSNGTSPVTPDGNGFYGVADADGLFFALTDVTSTSPNAPVINSITPALSGSNILEVYTTPGISKNRLSFEPDGGLGQQTYNVDVSWNDGTCVRNSVLVLKIEVGA